jgi:hypothetical protein
MKHYIPPQLTRLSLAFAIFIALFLLFRSFLVPDTFGDYSFYRGASLIENEHRDIHYSGQKPCIECHRDIEDKKAQDAHADIRCEACHGPGQKHVVSQKKADIFRPDGREFCGSCHEKNAAKQQSAIFQIDLREHNAGKNCISCHDAHQPFQMK